MKTFYHGTSKLFGEFRPLETIGTGEGKSKFGWGVYLTSAFSTAVLYSGKGPGREAADHYIYSVDIPDPDTHPEKYFVLHKPVPEDIASLATSEVGPISDDALGWGHEFRKELETKLFVKEYGRKPKSAEGGVAQKLAADWFYSHGIIGLIWPHGGWPKRGEAKLVDNLDVAMFNGKDIVISKIERIDVEFVAKIKKNPDKLTCVEKSGAERKEVDVNSL